MRPRVKMNGCWLGQGYSSAVDNAQQLQYVRVK